MGGKKKGRVIRIHSPGKTGRYGERAFSSSGCLERGKPKLFLRFACYTAKNGCLSQKWNQGKESLCYVCGKKCAQVHRAIQGEKHPDRHHCAGHFRFRLYRPVHPAGGGKRQRGKPERHECDRYHFGGPPVHDAGNAGRRRLRPVPLPGGYERAKRAFCRGDAGVCGRRVRERLYLYAHRHPQRQRRS